MVPHGLTVDARNQVWVSDVGRHQVFKFSQDGTLFLKLGEANVPGPDAALAPDEGHLYVTDILNNQVLQFAKTCVPDPG